MSTTPTFSAQLLGQTEKAANAILDRLLAEPGLTEPQWITLRITAMSSGTLDRGQLIDRVIGALKVSEAEAQARVAELVAAGLLRVQEGDPATVKLTDAGERLHAHIRAATTEITQRLWGDLPVEDLATAGRVLSTVLARADIELAGAAQAAHRDRAALPGNRS
jgi:DNA-binding MarR family transcriptional regulator